MLVIAVVSAATSGGGRELLPRDQAVAFPVSPTTDHLGALLMAPLNIAWLLQSWTVLAATSYAVGARSTLVPALLPALCWLVTATTVAQVLAWGVEWVRRRPRGTLVVRVGAGVVGVVAAALIGTRHLTDVLDHSPTLRIAVGVLDAAHGRWLPWTALMATLLALTVLAVAAGAWVAGRVARRPARDEVRAEGSSRPARANPGSDLLALVRTDRAGIWRSVPMRRGMVVLALFPGLVAVGGSFHWDMLGIFPGLVASGGALLFGVNSWCLDGRGALWRDSLPVGARLGFVSRVLVLTEILLVATLVTLLLASLRAGLPTPAQLVAVLCAAVVVTVQVVATSLRWSVRRPYAVDLRSSRATPAPPLVMVGYSTRLALSTTFTGLMFNTGRARLAVVAGAAGRALPGVVRSQAGPDGTRLGRPADPLTRGRDRRQLTGRHNGSQRPDVVSPTGVTSSTRVGQLVVVPPPPAAVVAHFISGVTSSFWAACCWPWKIWVNIDLRFDSVSVLSTQGFIAGGRLPLLLIAFFIIPCTSVQPNSTLLADSASLADILALVTLLRVLRFLSSSL